MSPPRKYPISNQDSNRITNKQDPILPPLLAKYPTGYKPFFNYTHFSKKTEEENKYSTNDSRNENKDSVNIMNVLKDEDEVDEYKEDNS